MFHTMRAMDGERFPPVPTTFLFHHLTTTREVKYGFRWWEKKVVGTGGNRSPSIARMVWDIVTSVYSSPKAFRSAESDEFDVLSALAAWAVPYRWPTKSDDPGDAGTETKVVEPTGRTS